MSRGDLGFRDGFVDPSGIFHDIGGEAHIEWAKFNQHLFGKQGLGSYEAFDAILDAGWIRIAGGGCLAKSRAVDVKVLRDVVRRIARAWIDAGYVEPVVHVEHDVDISVPSVQVPVTVTGRPDFSEFDEVFGAVGRTSKHRYESR